MNDVSSAYITKIGFGEKVTIVVLFRICKYLDRKVETITDVFQKIKTS